MIIALIMLVLVAILVYLIILGASICNRNEEQEMEDIINGKNKSE